MLDMQGESSLMQRAILDLDQDELREEGRRPLRLQLGVVLNTDLRLYPIAICP